MTTPFTRQLGARPGVQLNPLRDNSEIPALDQYDQRFGIMMRATRGRIDKPFLVNRGNIFKKIGRGEQVRVSALNEAWIHVNEALNNGAYEAVVQRLTTSAAVVKYAVAYIGAGAVFSPTVAGGAITAIAATTPGTGYTVGQALSITEEGGSGAAATVATIDANGGILTVTVSAGGTGYTTPTIGIANPISFGVSTTVPTGPYLFALKHLECYNDGIKIEFRAEEKKAAGVAVANDRITIRVLDKNGELLYEIFGSLDPTALDDYQNSIFLEDVISTLTGDNCEIEVGATTTIATTSPAYGYDSVTLTANWAKSGVLIAFTEGGTAYATDDYAAARVKLQNTPFNYAYISSGGSQSAGLIGQLIQLAFDTNRQLRMDVPGNLTPDAAITFVENLNLGGSPNAAHLVHVFWAPLRTNDPTGLNGKGYYGVATLNIAYACLRNADRNAKGFARKNFPIAGKEWPVNRRGVTQTYVPSEPELSALARAKINPVVSITYAGGARYAFSDTLTSAQVESSLKKLIAVADMSTSIDDAVTAFGNDVLQLPMEVAINRMSDFLRSLFEGAEASGWLVPSSDPFMEGRAWKFDVRQNEIRPYDQMDVSYWLRYDGTVRQIFVTQTLSR
jgi:hypothetical protein